MARKHADPVGRLNTFLKDQARSVGTPLPILGTFYEGFGEPDLVELVTGQVVENPIRLGQPYDIGSGDQVLCFWIQEGHDIAIIKVAESGPE